jgi:DNA-binding CsgD family transcriptional regulator
MSLLQSILSSININSDTLDIDLLDNIPFHTYVKDTTGKYISCNEQMAQAVGLTAQDIVGLNDMDIIKRKEALEVTATDNRVFATRKSVIKSEPFTTFEGKKLLANSFKSVLLSNQKKVIGLVGLSLIRPAAVLRGKYSLTPRQLDCLYYLVKGMTLKQISSALNLSPRTVEHYLEAVKSKMHTTRRSELIAMGMQLPEIQDRL